MKRYPVPDLPAVALHEALADEGAVKPAVVAQAKLPTAAGDDKHFYAGKIAAAKFFVKNSLPELASRDIVFCMVSTYKDVKEVVTSLLKGKANVFRPMRGQSPDNCGDTSIGLERIDPWLGERKWAVIHFNWGLHDIKVMDGKHQVGIEDYEKNLRALVAKITRSG